MINFTKVQNEITSLAKGFLKGALNNQTCESERSKEHHSCQYT